MVPVYVPGSKVTALTVTPNTLLLPLSVPDVAASTSQALLAVSPDTVQVTGRAQVPVSLTVTFCIGEAACPCGMVKVRLPGAGDDSTQGGRTVSVTAKVSGLPCTRAPLALLAAMVNCVL